MVNKDHMRIWLDALRSGNYEQAKSQLRSGDTFCCLGVACEVYRQETGLGRWDEEVFIDEKELGHVYDLPRPVADWLGLTEAGNPTVRVEQERRESVADLNDDDQPFDAIADFLEEEYL